MERSLRDCLEEVFDEADDFPADGRLSELPGWDSMTRVSLLMEIDDAFGVSLKESDLTLELTLAELENLLTQRKQP